jgi:predicted transcriptional regulator
MKALSIFADAKSQAIEEGMDAVRRGEVVDHDLVRKWLMRLAAGEDLPPPLPSRKRFRS